MKLKIVLIALAFLLPTVFVHAEDGLTPCFNYYKFGSVQVDVAPVNRNTLAGTDLIFNGNVRNTNSYPIVDGAVYVKIFRKASQSNVQSNGWELVDQFFAQKDLNIDGQKQLPISFSWRIPAYAVGGDYKLATYFVTQDKFNLSGLSFTDDITGTIIPFKITSEQTKTVLFDKSSVKINEQQFLFAAFTPKVTRDEDVQIIFNLKNEYAAPKNAELTYTLYSWDGLRNEKILNTKKETLSLKANETRSLSYTVTDKSYPVYYLVVESKVDDVKSIIDIRFARSGVEEARLNFPALANYPLKAGTEATMFSCFHNSGLGESVQGGKVVMTLTDGKGKQLDTYTWEGEITGKMMGVKKSFKPLKDYVNTILITDLYVNNKLVDSSRTYYECEKLNQEACLAEAMSEVGNTSDTMIKIVIGLAILVVIVAILAYRGHLKRKDVGVVALLFASTIGIGMYQVNAQLANADIFEDVQSSVELDEPRYSVFGYYDYDADEHNDILSMTAFNLNYSGSLKDFVFSPSVSTSTLVVRKNRTGWIFIDTFRFNYVYGAKMINAVTNEEIDDGATVPINTKIKFVPEQFNNNHIAWFLTGGTLDSPYAYWDQGTTPQCQDSDKFGEKRFKGTEGTYDVFASTFLPIVVKKPSVTVDVSGSTAALSANSDGSYTVTSPGKIKGIVKFAPTTANAYFQYSLKNMLFNDFGLAGILVKYANGTITETRFTSIQRDALNRLPSGPCKTLTNFEFPLEDQQIVLSADVNGPINEEPNAPTLTLSGTCVNSPTNIQIGAAIPVDPDQGDTVTYEYQVDYNSGYGATQTTNRAGESVTFTTTGLKKVRVRAVDNGGLTSVWVEKTINISNCAVVRVYCSEPVFKGSYWPEWTATVDNPSNEPYSISWVGPPSVPYVISGSQNSVFTSQSTVSSNGTRQGPQVTATIGTDTDTVQCLEANRGGNSSTGISGSCKIETIEGNVPSWKGIINNGRSPYERKWYKAGIEIPGETTNTYVFPRALNPGERIDDITTKIDAVNGSTGQIKCQAIEISNDPEIDLILKDNKSPTPTKRLTVQKGALAFANTTSNAVTGCFSRKTKKNSTIDLPWGTADFDTYSGGVGVSALTNYPLLTSETGEFELRVTCNDGATPPNILFSTSTLIITEIPNYEEF